MKLRTCPHCRQQRYIRVTSSIVTRESNTLLTDKEWKEYVNQQHLNLMKLAHNKASTIIVCSNCSLAEEFNSSKILMR